MASHNLDTPEIQTGINEIHRQFANGEIDKETAQETLTAFLAAKGILYPLLAASFTISNWRQRKTD